MKLIENCFIYKITNLITKEVYVGQTIRTIEWRWKRHISDSKGSTAYANTKLAKAIQQYGYTNFKVDEIEHLTNCTIELATQRERYWIYKLNTLTKGYNTQDPLVKRGGNTYAGKSPSELLTIREKLRNSKLGAKNPHSRKIRCIDVETNEIIEFSSMKDCQIYFNQTNHSFVSKRCCNKIKCLYKNKYKFEYM